MVERQDDKKSELRLEFERESWTLRKISDPYTANSALRLEQ